jgi:hypothetical protein
MRFAFLIGLLASCASNETTSTTATRAMPSAPPFNPQQAQAQAETFLRTLYPNQKLNGPVCMPEEVVDGLTQCSFTTTLDGIGPLQVGTILCGNTGCREGEAPVVVQQDLLPAQQAGSTTVVQNHGGVDNDWLFWYLLWSNGATTHHYHSWYTSTPVMYRGAYYSRGYVPAPAAVTSYRTNYSRAVTTNSSSKYSYKSSYKTTPASSSYKTTPTTTSRTTTGTKTTTTSSPKPSSSYRSTPKSAPSRSSGFSSPSRSSGFRSGGRR